MSAIDKAKAHFSAIGMLSIEVPEWELIIHYYPLTLFERRELLKDGRTDADALILKARDETGARLFREADRDDLMRRVDDAIVRRIAAALTAAPSVKEQEKNSAPIPS